ncbi:MAG: hypothetical protein AB7N76_14755 [Planctomycetota bacterium]
MREILSCTTALAVVLVVCADASAKEQLMTAVVSKDGEEGKQEGRTKVATMIVEQVLKEEGLLAKVTGKERDALVQASLPLLTREKLSKYSGGRFRYMCRVDPDLVREKAAAAGGGGGAKAEARKVYLGLELTGQQGPRAEELSRLFRNAFATRLKKSGHELVEGDPKQAPSDGLVASVILGIKFEPFDPKEARAKVYAGRVRLRSSTVRLYDKARNSVVLQENLASDQDTPEPMGGNPSYDRIYEAMIQKGQAPDQKEEAYADFLGACVAHRLVKKLNTMGGRAGSGGAEGGEGVLKADYYQLRFKGYEDGELLKKVVESIRGVKGIKYQGKVAIFEVFRFEYTGGDLLKDLRAALKKKRVEGKITNVGNNVNVIKE